MTHSDDLSDWDVDDDEAQEDLLHRHSTPSVSNRSRVWVKMSDMGYGFLRKTHPVTIVLLVIFVVAVWFLGPLPTIIGLILGSLFLIKYMN